MGAPRFFRTPDTFRGWLDRHHSTKGELWIGFYKKASGKGGMTYAEAVDEALCFGWIDGVVRSIDADSFMQRFTPRTRTSHWSLVNLRKFAALDAAGRITPAGRAAFDRKTPARIGQASFESPPKAFTPAQRKEFEANPKAWAFFQAQPAGYRRVTTFWVTQAKQDATRARRLSKLIECSARGERVSQFVSPAKR